MSVRDSEIFEIMSRLKGRQKDIFAYVYNPWRKVNGQRHLKQHEFHTATEKVISLLGAVRSGKTAAMLSETAARTINLAEVNRYFAALPKRERGDAMILCPSRNLQTAPGGVQESFLRFIPAEYILDMQTEKGAVVEMLLRDGIGANKLQFRTYGESLDNFQTMNLKTVACDEMPPYEIFEELFFRTFSCKGRIFVTLHNADDANWVMKTFEKADKSVARTIYFHIEDNPYAPAEEIEKAKLFFGANSNVIHRRLYGEQLAAGELALPYDRRKHVKTWQQFQEMTGHTFPPHTWDWYMGADWGYSPSPAAFYHAVLDPDGRLWIVNEMYQTRTLPRDFAQRIKQYESSHNLRVDRRKIDSRAGEVIILLENEGLIFDRASSNRDMGLNRLRDWMECNRLYLIQEETPWMQWEMGRWVGQNRDDHAIDAVRYLIEQLPDVLDMGGALKSGVVRRELDSVSEAYWKIRHAQTIVGTDTFSGPMPFQMRRHARM